MGNFISDLIGSLVDPIADADIFGGQAAAQAQTDASDSALAAQQEEIRRAQRVFDQKSAQASATLDNSNFQAQGQLQQLFNQSQGDLDAAGRDLRAGQIGAQGHLNNLSQLQRFIDPATQSINAFDVTGGQDRLGGVLDQGGPGGPDFSKFQESPGFQFRQQQGEEAINRSAAARGGRLSGRTLKELGGFNQGLASQEFNNFANRELAANQQLQNAFGQQISGAAQSDASRQNALLNQAGRTDQAALIAQGNQANFGSQGAGALGSLAQVAQSSGRDQAALDQLRAQSDQSLGSQLAQMTSNTGSNIANILTGQGANATNTLGSSLGAIGDNVGFQGLAGQARAGESAQILGQLLGAAFG